MDNRCVVFYDSGVGGTLLLERTRKAFPRENYVYFADEKNMPFGSKTQAELENIFEKALTKIKSFCPKLLVVACNTMSCTVCDNVYALPFETIFVTPFAPDCEKANKSSCEGHKGLKWLLLTTPATAETIPIKRLMQSEKGVTLSPQPTLAKEIELWQSGGKKPDISLKFKDFPRDYDYVFLGCTHYGFLKEDFAKIFPNSKIISGEDRAFDKICNFLNTFDNQNGENILYFAKSQ